MKDFSIVSCFGRFNPPTKGHILLFKKMDQIAKSKKAIAVIGTSQTHDKKNPLTFTEKTFFLQEVLKEQGFDMEIALDPSIKTIFQFIPYLVQVYPHVKKLYFVCGSDRLKEFQTVLDKYFNTTLRPDIPVGFSEIEVVSSGHRDPDSENLESAISATKVRQAVIDGDFEQFQKGIALKNPGLIQEAWEIISKYYGVNGF